MVGFKSGKYSKDKKTKKDWCALELKRVSHQKYRQVIWKVKLSKQFMNVFQVKKNFVNNITKKKVKGLDLQFRC